MSKKVQLAINCLPFIIVLLCVLLTKILEPIFFPIITGFTVHSVAVDKQVVTISGTMKKERNCTFESIQAYSIFSNDKPKHRNEIVLLDLPVTGDATRPIGHQAWGPWQVTIPVTPETVAIELDSLHSCHFIWTQITPLATVPLIYTKN